ncbi:MAG: DUF424 family protein [Nanoarchaeota archaeon]|nr:DUF424 family protein [Nanoarchaeota archaeon]
MITHKLHVKGKELVLAACDEDLIGKTLHAVNGAEIFINPSFYKGEHVSADKLVELVREATIVNLFGKETLNAVKSLNLNVLNIGGVPHSQVFKIL